MSQILSFVLFLFPSSLIAFPTTSPPGTCFYEEKWYPVGIIERGSWDGGTYVVWCEPNGEVLIEDKLHQPKNPCQFSPVGCDKPTTPHQAYPPTDIPHRTTSPPGTCFYEEKWYPVGEIERGSWDGGTYVVWCEPNGEVLIQDIVHQSKNLCQFSPLGCDKPTTPHQTTPPTRTTTTQRPTTETTPPIRTTTTQRPTTETTPPTTQIPTTKAGCEFGGKWYPPGDVERSECGGIICQSDGQLVAWDNFNCFTTTTTQRPTTETTPPTRMTTTQRPTTRATLPTIQIATTKPGCNYGSRWYPSGAIIKNWSCGRKLCTKTVCYGNHIVVYDNPVSTRAPPPPFTTLPQHSTTTTTPPPTTSPPHTTTTTIGCYHNGTFYFTGSIINDSLRCTGNGEKQQRKVLYRWPCS